MQAFLREWCDQVEWWLCLQQPCSSGVTQASTREVSHSVRVRGGDLEEEGGSPGLVGHAVSSCERELRWFAKVAVSDGIAAAWSGQCLEEALVARFTCDWQ